MTSQSAVLTAEQSALVGDLKSAIGSDRILTDDAVRSWAGHDIFFKGRPPLCVVVPRSKEQVAAIVRLAASHGAAVVPRGGGMSYTRGYLADAPDIVMLDLAALDRIVAVDKDNLFVTVECGCSWSKLYDALAEQGLRLPVFGTMSGRNATVGGGLSQGSIFYGSSRYGTSADMVLGLEVVLADGTIIRTGQAATGTAKPFFRYYGPDLGGNFLGDGGALGVKVEATFRVIPMPGHIGALSFAFKDFESAWKTQTAIGRAGLAAEVFSFDAVLQHQLMERTSLIDDMAALRKVATGGGNLFKGMRDAVRVALTGKRFMDDAPYSVHVVAEERHDAALKAAMAEIRDIAGAAGGDEIPNSIPTVMRAQPFGKMDMTLGPAGERWVPVHGLVALSDGLEAMKRVQDYFQGQAERMVQHKILAGILTMVVAPSVFVIEALFYWPDSPSPLHEKVVSPEKLAQGRRFAENPAARQMVAELRAGVADVFATLGGGHFGVGRSLPYRKYRDPQSYALLQKIKQALDPEGRLNPGVLGLDGQ